MFIKLTNMKTGEKRIINSANIGSIFIEKDSYQVEIAGGAVLSLPLETLDQLVTILMDGASMPEIEVP